MRKLFNIHIPVVGILYVFKYLVLDDGEFFKKFNYTKIIFYTSAFIHAISIFLIVNYLVNLFK